MAAIQASDVLPVRSRVSWSAILAGSFIALTIYIVLATLGLAMGLTLSDRMTNRGLAIGAGIWMVASMLIALFCGGGAAARATAGEDRTEAAMMGVIVWAVTCVLMFWLSSQGLQGAFGLANTSLRAAGDVRNLSEDDLRQAGFTDAQIESMRGQFDRLRGRVGNAGEEARDVARDPRTVAAAWWTLVGIVVSLAASVFGGVCAAGPHLVLTSLRMRGGTVVTQTTSRETVTH